MRTLRFSIFLALIAFASRSLAAAAPPYPMPTKAESKAAEILATKSPKAAKYVMFLNKRLLRDTTVQIFKETDPMTLEFLRPFTRAKEKKLQLALENRDLAVAIIALEDYQIPYQKRVVDYVRNTPPLLTAELHAQLMRAHKYKLAEMERALATLERMAKGMADERDLADVELHIPEGTTIQSASAPGGIHSIIENGNTTVTVSQYDNGLSDIQTSQEWFNEQFESIVDVNVHVTSNSNSLHNGEDHLLQGSSDITVSAFPHIDFDGYQAGVIIEGAVNGTFQWPSIELKPSMLIPFLPILVNVDFGSVVGMTGTVGVQFIDTNTGFNFSLGGGLGLGVGAEIYHHDLGPVDEMTGFDFPHFGIPAVGVNHSEIGGVTSASGSLGIFQFHGQQTVPLQLHPANSLPAPKHGNSLTPSVINQINNGLSDRTFFGN